MSTDNSTVPLSIVEIAQRIRLIRGQRVVLDTDLAAFYGETTKRFNQQVRRNLSRFPADFMFLLDDEEFAALRLQSATLNSGFKTGRGQHRKYLPYAFTEHGAIMAAMVLGSPHAMEVSVYVVRAFVRLRQVATTHADLAKRLAELEMKTESLELSHDTFSRNTRAQLKQVFDALRELMAPPDPPKAPMGFVPQEDKKGNKARKK